MVSVNLRWQRRWTHPKLRLADMVIKPTIWRAVKVATKVKKSAKERIWGSSIMLLHMASGAEIVEGWATAGMAIVGLKLLLTVREEASLEH